MNLADIASWICAHERIDFHDLRTEMPELARHALLPAPLRFPVGLIGIAEFLPKPAARAGKNTRRMRPQFCASQQVTVAFALVGHPDWNIDPCPVARTRHRVRNVAMKRDILHIIVEENGDPALAEPIEAKRPAAWLDAHVGRLGTIAIGLKV